MGLGSALETLCGQAYGAKHVDALGLYMQRSWVIVNTTCIALIFMFIFATPILKQLGQDDSISLAAGQFSKLMFSQQFAYALAVPLAKFLQAQSKVVEIAAISTLALLLNAVLGWLLMLKFGWGLTGAAVVLNSSWWFIPLNQLFYVVSGECGQGWLGFSWKAFINVWGFVKLSISSAIMFCLEIWYTMALTLIAGYLLIAVKSVAALSTCMNINGWSAMVGLAFNVAISVRVSNKLGSGQPRAAKFSILVVGLTSLILSLAVVSIMFIGRYHFPALFTTCPEIQELVADLTPLFGGIIILTVIQYALSGVAIGAGWQNFVAYINAVCYFLLGVPLSFFMGKVFDMGVKGIWYGLACQSGTLLWVTCTTNWNKEVYSAEKRLEQWVGEIEENQ